MHVVRYYPRALVGDGGMTASVRNWSEALVRAGIDVTIAHDPAPGVEPPRNGVRYAPVRRRAAGVFSSIEGLEPVLADADLLVLHSAWTHPNIVAARTARARGVPYLLEPRGAYDPRIVARNRVAKRAWWLAFERGLVRGARAIHVFHEPERAHLRALGWDGPMVVASNGASPAAGAWDGGSEGSVVWLGRFDPQHKGLDSLLAALATIPIDERPRVRLIGPDWRGRGKAATRALIARAGVEAHATVEEPVYADEKVRTLSSARAFVYPSRWEACPNSLLEAASYGIPALVTPYPTGAFLAERGGAIIAERTPAALAEGLRAVVREEAAQVGARGARIVASELTWDQVALTWLEQVKGIV